MEIPKDWNPEAIIATLRDQANKLFKIKFVRKGSLIMLTTISASILSDSELFEAAVMSFLTKMMEDCDINTEIPGRVEVKLHILNVNEGLLIFLHIFTCNILSAFLRPHTIICCMLYDPNKLIPCLSTYILKRTYAKT